MKIILLTVIFFISSKLVKAQQILKIHYEYSFSKSGTELKFLFEMIDNGKTSFFQESKDRTKQILGKTVIMSNQNSKENGLVYDKVKDKIYYSTFILSKKVGIIEDSALYLQKWSLTDSLKKTILSFPCKSAVCSFRGREYVAFYTDSLGFYSGPYKFCGLPGTILEVVSKDGVYKYTAQSIELKNEAIPLINYYEAKSKNFMSFKEFKELQKKKLMEAQMNANSKEKEKDVSYTFTDNSMELN